VAGAGLVLADEGIREAYMCYTTTKTLLEEEQEMIAQ
jgi:hypothetical protein